MVRFVAVLSYSPGYVMLEAIADDDGATMSIAWWALFMWMLRFYTCC